MSKDLFENERAMVFRFLVTANIDILYGFVHFQFVWSWRDKPAMISWISECGEVRQDGNADDRCGSSDHGFFIFKEILQYLARGSLEWVRQWDRLSHNEGTR